MQRLLTLLLILLVFTTQSSGLLHSVSEEQEFEVIPNPHDKFGAAASSASSSSNGNNLDHFLEPYYLITKPLPTQVDTFQELTYAKVLTVPVPVYRMKQPARLSSAELEFQLVLVKGLSSAGSAQIRTIEVDMEKASDSWFPGYYWSPLAMFCEETNAWKHVGWKFTATDHHRLTMEGTHNQSLDQFYALMIQMDNRERESVAVRIGGFRAPGWMAARILS